MVTLSQPAQPASAWLRAPDQAHSALPCIPEQSREPSALAATGGCEEEASGWPFDQTGERSSKARRGTTKRRPSQADGSSPRAARAGTRPTSSSTVLRTKAIPAAARRSSG
jgi:hypothetical protein